MPELGDSVRVLAGLALATVTALAVTRGIGRVAAPPGFAQPWRRVAAATILVWVLFIGVFLPLVMIDLPQDVDVESLGYGELFLSHALLLATVAVWVALGWAGLGRHGSGRDPGSAYGTASAVGDASVDSAEPVEDWAAALRLRTSRPLRELGIGVVAGAGAWAAVLAALILVAGVLTMSGRAETLTNAPPAPLIVFLAGLPVGMRIAISVSAGVFEELFFRGFLQPRIGIAASTACFVLGHLAYGQPLMLVGLTILSLLYAWLARRRGNIWAAAMAHTIFDAVQLLVVIPAALAALEREGEAAPLLPLAALW